MILGIRIRITLMSLLCIPLLSCIGPVRSPELVSFRLSKTNALLNFLHAVTGTSPSSPSLKDAFVGSPYDTGEMRSILSEYAASWAGMMGDDIRRGLAEASGEAANLDDFEMRARIFLNESSRAALFMALRAIEPAYDALIWQPLHGEMEKILGIMRKSLHGGRFEDLVKEAASFYEISLAESREINVFLVPLPVKNGNAVSQSNRGAITLAVLRDPDIDRTLSVAFHEICHCLAADRQDEIRDYFIGNPSAYAAPAAAYFEEAVVTALGAWAYANLGNEDELSGELYNDEYIDGFAKALYPEIVRRLDARQPLDREFCDRAVEEFGRAFPNSPTDFEAVHSSIFLSTDQVEVIDSDAIPRLRRYFSANDIEYESPMDGKIARELLPATRRAIVLMVSIKELPRLAVALDYLPFLEPYRKDLLSIGSDTLFSIMDDTGRAIVIMIIEDSSHLEKAILAMKGASIDPGNPFRFL